MPTRHRPAPPATSRDQIIEALLWEALTVEELAGRVGLTPNGIRAQLVGLERDGQVARTGRRSAGRVGKPPVHYALTQQAEQEFSVAYPAALTAIVETLRAGQDPKALEGILTAAGVRLAGSVNARNAKGVLGALGAKVRSVATTGGGETVQGASCPLATTVSREPVTCELVRSLLATTLGRAVQMHCQHGDRPRCCFKIAPVRNQALRA